VGYNKNDFTCRRASHDGPRMNLDPSKGKGYHTLYLLGHPSVVDAGALDTVMIKENCL